jgi:hypothetical protein
MSVSFQQIIDYGKQIQALLAGAPPLAIWKYGFLGINPPIVSQLSLVALAFAIPASAFAFNAPQQPLSRMPSARTLGICGFAVTILSVAALMLITGEHILGENPPAQDFFTRAFFLLTFVGLGLFMGWQTSLISRMLARI